MPSKVTEFQVSWKDISPENYALNKEIQQWEGEHHYIKAKEAWQKSVREDTACVRKVGRSRGIFIVSERPCMCSSKKLAIENMYLTQPSENYKCLKANLKDHGPGSETSTLNSILEQLNQQMRVMSGDGVGE